MKVAVSTDSGMVAEHFGRCPQFTIAEINGGKVEKAETIENPGHATGFLPNFFSEKGIDVLVAGGAGSRAQQICSELGIKLVLGISGKVGEVLEMLAKGELEEGESSCSPGKGKGYGIPKEDGNE